MHGYAMFINSCQKNDNYGSRNAVLRSSEGCLKNNSRASVLHTIL